MPSPFALLRGDIISGTQGKVGVGVNGGIIATDGKGVEIFPGKGLAPGVDAGSIVTPRGEVQSSAGSSNPHWYFHLLKTSWVRKKNISTPATALSPIMSRSTSAPSAPIGGYTLIRANAIRIRRIPTVAT